METFDFPTLLTKGCKNQNFRLADLLPKNQKKPSPIKMTHLGQNEFQRRKKRVAKRTATICRQKKKRQATIASN